MCRREDLWCGNQTKSMPAAIAEAVIMILFSSMPRPIKKKGGRGHCPDPREADFTR
jgi:hypothetical protein